MVYTSCGSKKASYSSRKLAPEVKIAMLVLQAVSDPLEHEAAGQGRVMAPQLLPGDISQSLHTVKCGLRMGAEQPWRLVEDYSVSDVAELPSPTSALGDYEQTGHSSVQQLWILSKSFTEYEGSVGCVPGQQGAGCG